MNDSKVIRERQPYAAPALTRVHLDPVGELLMGLGPTYFCNLGCEAVNPSTGQLCKPA